MSRRVRWHARFPCIFITIREKYRSSAVDAIRWRRPTKDRGKIPRNPFVKPTGQSVATTMSLFSPPSTLVAPVFPSVSSFGRIPSREVASFFLSFSFFFLFFRIDLSGVSEELKLAFVIYSQSEIRRARSRGSVSAFLFGARFSQANSRATFDWRTSDNDVNCSSENNGFGRCDEN